MTDKVIGIISVELAEPIGRIKLETPLEDIVKDSIDIIGLVAALSGEFNIRVKPEELADIKTVQDIVNYISSHREEAGKGTLEAF